MAPQLPQTDERVPFLTQLNQHTGPRFGKLGVGSGRRAIRP